jgi:phosphatidylserine decarboxylase
VERLLDWLYRDPLGRLLRPLLTRSRLLHAAVERLADAPASALLVPWAVRSWGIDLTEAEVPPGGFPTLNALFTRALRPGARPLDPDPAVLVSPADARLLAVSPLDAAAQLRVKGVGYDAARLLADDGLARGYAGGAALVFRLYLADVHRLAFPCDGLVSAPRLVPGATESVSPRPGHRSPVLQRNRRTVTTLDSGRFGRLALVDVGGFLVASIHHLLPDGARVVKGQPRSLFRLGGSTLVLLAPPGALEVAPEVLAASARGEETPVRLGAAVARAPAARGGPAGAD